MRSYINTEGKNQASVGISVLGSNAAKLEKVLDRTMPLKNNQVFVFVHITIEVMQCSVEYYLEHIILQRYIVILKLCSY